MDEMNLAEVDYSLPDPAWEYSQVYRQAISLHQVATEMIAELSEQERATAEADGPLCGGSRRE